MTDDILFIRQLPLKTIIGVYPYERKIKQTVILDLELAYDSKVAAKSNDLKDAWNYASLVEELTTLLESLQCHLIEALEEEISTHVFSYYPCQWLRLTLIKQNAFAGSTQVGLTITRNRG